MKPEEHVAAARRICRALGTVQHVATQDWMCEADMLRLTGLSVIEHQLRTIRSMLFCRDAAPELPWMPALQGFTVDDYLRCADLYAAHGVDLTALPLVGLGSVCRRSGTRELEYVIGELARRLPGIPFHGYGVKSDGTLLSCLDLRSVDSDAWSERGRWMENELRLALGLNLKARWPAVVEAMAARGDGVDFDFVSRFEWMRELGLGVGNLQNSILWAEVWRAAQQERIAVAAMQRAVQVAEAVMPGQLRLVLNPAVDIYTPQAEVVSATMAVDFFASLDGWGDVHLTVEVRRGAMPEEILAAVELVAGELPACFELQTDLGVYVQVDDVVSFKAWEQAEVDACAA